MDCRYIDLISDPRALLREICDRVGLDWPSGHEERIVAYLRDEPKGKFGRHEYALEAYGLDAELVRNAYSDYITHDGIEPES